jgi:hypothetical protein
MKALYALLLVVALFASGCSTYAWHVKQYTISRATSDPADAALVKTILQEVAAQAGLPACPEYVTSYNYLAYYQSETVTLEAAFRRDQIWIQLTGGHKASPAYKRAKRLLVPALSTGFGNRVCVTM